MFYGLSSFIKKLSPKSLFYRSLIIVATPIILLQSVQGIPFSYEGNLLFDFKNKFFLNFNYSHQISSGISASILLDDAIQLSYTFELPTKSLQSYGFNSHEISLKFLMHKNNNLLIMKDIENLKNQNNQLFEKTDFMEQNQIAQKFLKIACSLPLANHTCSNSVPTACLEGVGTVF